MSQMKVRTILMSFMRTQRMSHKLSKFIVFIQFGLLLNNLVCFFSFLSWKTLELWKTYIEGVGVAEYQPPPLPPKKIQQTKNQKTKRKDLTWRLLCFDISPALKAKILMYRMVCGVRRLYLHINIGLSKY